MMSKEQIIIEYLEKFEVNEARALVMQYLVSAAKYSIEHCRIPDYARRIPEELPSLCYLDGVRSLIFYLGKMQLSDDIPFVNSGNPDHIDSIDKAFLAEV